MNFSQLSRAEGHSDQIVLIMASRLPFSNGAYCEYNSPCQNNRDAKASYFSCPTVEDVDHPHHKKQDKSIFRRDPACVMFMVMFCLIVFGIGFLGYFLEQDEGEQYYTLTEVKWANISENYTLSESEIQSVFDFLTSHQIEPNGTLFLLNGSVTNETTEGAAIGIPYQIRHYSSQEELDAAIESFMKKAVENETSSNNNMTVNSLAYDRQSDIWHYRRPSFFTLLWLGAWHGNWHGGRSRYGYQFGPRHGYAGAFGAAAASPAVRGMFGRSGSPATKAGGFGSILNKLGLGGRKTGVGAMPSKSASGPAPVKSPGKSGGWLGGWSGGRSSGGSTGRGGGGRGGGGRGGGRGRG